MVLMQFSDNAMLKHIFTEPVAMPSAGQKFKNTKFKGCIDTFRVQLLLHHPPTLLLCRVQEPSCSILDASVLHFVRCFKPNDKKAPDCWEQTTLSRQLHTSGVLDALRVARTGFRPDAVRRVHVARSRSCARGAAAGDVQAAVRGDAEVGGDRRPRRTRLGQGARPPRVGRARPAATARLQAMGAVVTRVQAGRAA